MIAAWQKDELLLDDIHSRQQMPGIDLWWLGQSGFLLRAGKRHVLIDPYLSDSLTKKYADTDKPHVRMSEQVVDPLRLDFIDVVVCTHSHTDHLDPETLSALFQANPSLVLVVPAAIRPLAAARAGMTPERPIGLTAGAHYVFEEMQIHAVPSAHNELDQDVEGRHLYLGYVIKASGYTIYHSGDTLPYEGLEAWLRPYGIQLALLPINGHRPERRVAGNLDAAQSVLLARSLGVDLTIPCHYDMFAFNTADVGDFEREARQAGIGHRILRAGERLSLPES